MFSLSGESGMATLLQQKSCGVKTLANGGGNGAQGSATTTTHPHEIVAQGSVQTTEQTTSQFSNFLQYSNYTNFTPPTAYQVVNTTSSIFSTHPHQLPGSTGASSVVVISPESIATNGDADDIIEEDDGIEDATAKPEDSECANGLKEEEEEQEAEPEVDIVINNVVCSFSVRCHLNLREIALNGFNVEFRRENGMVTMKLRRPYTTASIWSSGKITCTGATSEDQAKIAARRYARCLQKLGFSVRFRNFRVVNVLGTCSMPWGIRIVNFSEKYRKDASYEPELHPGVTYKLKTPKATLKIFSTGSITVTAGSVAFVQAAIEHIFPLVYEFRKARAPPEPPQTTPMAVDAMGDDVVDQHSGKRRKKVRRPFGRTANDTTDNIMYVSDVEEYD